VSAKGAFILSARYYPDPGPLSSTRINYPDPWPFLIENFLQQRHYPQTRKNDTDPPLPAISNPIMYFIGLEIKCKKSAGAFGKTRL
jgi:hypothetical protein